MVRFNLKLITFGCRLNQAESRMMGEALCSRFPGLKVVNSLSIADIVIINSCSVTQKADKEVRQMIRKIKRENPDCFLIVSGCWAEKLFKKSPRKFSSSIDLLIENKNKMKLPEILKKKLGCFKKPLLANFYKDKYASSGKALIKIQEGCNNFCTYCIVPFLRGRSISRPIKEIIKEVNIQIKEGIKEIILTGVEVSDYQPSLAKLVKDILKFTKIDKISFGSININAFNREFLKLYEDKKIQPRLTSHFHIPLQSGCNNVLARMRRKYGVEDFFRKLQILKKIIPNFSFSTDIIVGFPGETQEEFEETMITLKKFKKLLGKRFRKTHVFRYSPRQGTMAAKKEGEKNWEKVKEKSKIIRSRKVRFLLNT